MAAETHSFAYYTGLPLAGANLTPEGAGAALTTSRVAGKVVEENEFKIRNVDENESGQMVGERLDDKTRRIRLTLHIPTGATIPAIGTVITIASASSFSNRYNGVWKIDDIGLAFDAKDRVELPVTLIKHEYFDYSA